MASEGFFFYFNRPGTDYWYAGELPLEDGDTLVERGEAFSVGEYTDGTPYARYGGLTFHVVEGSVVLSKAPKGADQYPFGYWRMAELAMSMAGLINP